MGWGGDVQVPLPDERMQQTIDKVGLGDSELRTLYKRFCKFDKEIYYRHANESKIGASGKLISSKSGTIDVAEFYTSFKEKESAFGNAIFKLIDVDNSGVLDFSEYVSALSTFCLFGREDILKYKNGTIEGEELDSLLNMLHSEGQNSNLKTAMEKFDFNADGKIDYDEFKILNHQFPALLYPAFRMQQNMRKYTLGEHWWTKQLESISQEKSDTLNKDELIKKKQLVQRKKLQKRAAKARMGCLKYYLCPCRRSRYIVQDMDDDDDEDNEEEFQPTEDQMKAHQDALRRIEEMKKNRNKKGKKKNNIVDLGQREPLSKEERRARAMKRRQRDMNDRPGRK